LFVIRSRAAAAAQTFFPYRNPAAELEKFKLTFSSTSTNP